LIEALAPAASQFVMAAASSPRAATPGELRASAARVAPGVACFESASPQDAVATALTLGDPIVVAGSLYLAGEVRANLWYTR
jgi:folylpolyglutamate synthase/dihydropteroate synthase